MVPRPRTWTDDQLADAVRNSPNLYQVCQRLGISPGKRTYEQLRRHIARIGIDASHLPKVERSRRRRMWTDDDLRAAVATSESYSNVMRKLGYTPSGGVHRYIASCIEELGIDTSHFTGQAWNRGRRYTGTRAIPLEEILVRRSTYRSNADVA